MRPDGGRGGRARVPVRWLPLWPSALLVALAVAIELVLLFGWLRPMSLLRWQSNPPAGAPVVVLLGQTRDGALRFAVPALLLVLLYAAAVRLSSRATGRAATLVALLAPVLFVATLVPMFPGGTQDIFHNIADGRLLWLHGENPTLTPPSAYPEDAFYRHLFGYNELTSAYGPLWYLLTGIPVLLAGDGLVANVIAQKALTGAFLPLTAALVWWGARRHRPERALQAAVIAGWCPLLLWEFAGNGHNDSVMLFFAAAAILAAAGRRWLWVFPLLALSVLIKFTTLLLGPVLLVWMLRRGHAPPRRVAAGLGLGALVVVLAYLPFWAGWDTLRLLDRPGMTFILSPATLLYGVLARWSSRTAAEAPAYAISGALFAMLYLVTLGRAARRTPLRREEEKATSPREDTPREDTPHPGRPARPSLSGERGRTAIPAVEEQNAPAAVCFDALFVYLVLASWWFWPWYLSWLAAPAAWCAGGRRAWVFVLATSAALFTYLYWWSDPPEFSARWFIWYTLIALGVFAVPFSLWATGGRVATRFNREH